MEQVYNIHACDDHEIVLKGIHAVITTVSHFVFTSSNSKKELLFAINTNPIDILILDINVNNNNMLNLIPEIKTLIPKLKIILFTNYDTSEIIKEVIKHKINGFLNKSASADDIIFCINQVILNKRYLAYEGKSNSDLKDKYELLNELTERELDVLRLLVKGLPNKQIADSLNISVLTVQTHRKNMYQKLHIKGINELVSFAYENNLY